MLRTRAGQLPWLVVLLWLQPPLPAHAVRAETQQNELEVRRTDPASIRTPAGQAVSLRGDVRFDDLQGAGEWRVRWNELTRTPHRAYGTRAPVTTQASPGVLLTAEIESLSETFVRAHRDLLSVGWDELSPTFVGWKGGRWVVTLQQLGRGLEVVGGRVDLRFSAQGELFLFGADAYPVPPTWAVADIGDGGAIAAALRDMPAGTLPHAGSVTRVFLPMLARELVAGWRKASDSDRVGPEDLRVRPAYRLRLKTVDPPGDWETYVDAETGVVLWRVNHVRFANAAGTLSGSIHPHVGTAAPVTAPFRDAEILAGAPVDNVEAFDFEGALEGWSAPSPWALSGESVHGGTRAWSDSPGVNYADNRNLALLSPKIDVRNIDAPALLFWVRVELEDTWDFLYVEASADNGVTWSTLMGMSGNAAWHEELISLSAFAGTNNLRVRFRLSSDGAANAAGCWIDDVVIARLGSTVTGASGNFAVTSTGTDSTLVTRMRGPSAQVWNRYAGGTSASMSVQAVNGTENLFWSGANSRANERDAFYGVTAAHARLRAIEPGFTALEFPFPVFVGIPFCNAYYAGWQIVMGSGSAGCADLGLWTSVVAHEYGHAITDHVYGAAGDPPSDMHEAFSDYFAATISNDPRVGDGVMGPGTMFRTIDNQLRTPEDVSGEVHIDGTILGGALWDLRRILAPNVELADSLFHFARYGAPKTFEDYYLELLTVDDDDADLGDGTPHIDAIRSSFGRHGIGSGPEFEHVFVAVEDDANDNARLDPGEQATLWLTLRNYGGEETGVYATISTQTPGVSVLIDSVQVGDVPSGSVGVPVGASTGFTVHVDASVDVGTAIVFDLDIHSRLGSNRDRFMLPVGWVPVLLVDDDRTVNFETWFTSSLERLHCDYLRWEPGILGSPTAEEMSTYRAVVWFTGNDRRNTLTPADQAELAVYLGAGGELFLTGEDIGEDLWKGTGGVATPADKAFYENWLRAKVNVESEGAPSVSGLAGDPVSHGLAMTLNGTTSANNLNSCSSLLPFNGSVEAMRYANGRAAALRYEGAYKLLYCGFGFEGVTTATQRDTLMARTLRWLMPPESTPPSVTVVRPNGGEVLPAGASYDIEWTAHDAVDVTAVDISISMDGGQNWIAVATGIANTHSFTWIVPETNATSCRVRIQACDPSGNWGSDASNSPFAIAVPTDTTDDLRLPSHFALRGAVPNPFNPATALHFDLARASRVWLRIVGVDGRSVRTLLDGEWLPAGRFQRGWNGRDNGGQSVASGVYFVQFRAGDFTAARKIHLLR